MLLSNLLSNLAAGKKPFSALTASPARRRRGVSWWFLVGCVISISCCHGPHHLAVWAQSTSTKEQCIQETTSLTSQIGYQLISSGIQQDCNTSGVNMFCAYNFSVGADLVKDACTQLGGSFYVLEDYYIKCDATTGGTSTFAYNQLGTCAGASCSQSIIQSQIELSLGNASDSLASALGYTSCSASVGSVTLSSGGSGSMSPPSSPAPTAGNISPAPSGGNNSPVQSSGSNSPAPSAVNSSPSPVSSPPGGSNSPPPPPSGNNSPPPSSSGNNSPSPPGGAKLAPTSGGARPIVIMAGAFATGLAAAAHLLVAMLA